MITQPSHAGNAIFQADSGGQRLSAGQRSPAKTSDLFTPLPQEIKESIFAFSVERSLRIKSDVCGRAYRISTAMALLITSRAMHAAIRSFVPRHTEFDFWGLASFTTFLLDQERLASGLPSEIRVLGIQLDEDDMACLFDGDDPAVPASTADMDVKRFAARVSTDVLRAGADFEKRRAQMADFLVRVPINLRVGAQVRLQFEHGDAVASVYGGGGKLVVESEPRRRRCLARRPRAPLESGRSVWR